jgi:twinkle protein
MVGIFGFVTIVDTKEFQMLHEKHKAWLEERKIDPVIAEKFGLETIQRAGANWLSIPYVERGQVINHKYRLTARKDHRMDQGAPLTLCNHDVLLRSEISTLPVIITEGELDMLIAIQSGFDLTLSVPNGASQSPNLEYIDRSKDILRNVCRFVLAVDGDLAGNILREELARRLGPAKCFFVEYPEACKDLNEVMELYGQAEVVRVINEAKPYPIKGLYRMNEIPEPPPFHRISLGIPGLAEFISIVPGTLTVLTGHAGHGKSSLSMAILANLMASDVAVAVASFETMPRPILRNRLLSHILKCSENDLKHKDLTEADELLNRKLSIFYQSADDEDSWDIQAILDLAAGAVIRDGIRLLFIDPWNEIEHKKLRDESETDYIGRSLRSIKRFARDFGVAVWIVAHPAKPDMSAKLSVPGLLSISGTANFANKADYGLVSHRTNKESNQVEIHVTKVRMGYPGKHGKLTLEYDWRDSSYRDATIPE